MKYKHIIWDWNGTLWNDTELCTEINNHMLRRRNLPEITLQTYRAKLCFPVDQYYRQLGFDYTEDPYKKLAEEFIAEYAKRRYECPLQGGARELMRDLQECGVTQAILSAYEQEALLHALQHFELLGYFEDVIGLNDIYAAGKVENGLKYMSQLGVDAADILFVGDTIHDFEVAESMGVASILVACGHNTRSRLETCGVPVFDELAEIRSFILG